LLRDCEANSAAAPSTAAWLRQNGIAGRLAGAESVITTEHSTAAPR
jgi:hypothetical protein